MAEVGLEVVEKGSDAFSIADQMRDPPQRQNNQLAALEQVQQLYSQITISGHARVHLGNQNVNQQNVPQEPVEKPFMVPFSRDRQYVTRPNVIEDLERCVDTTQHSRMALAGMGGVGKTQIAVEFAHRYRERHQDAAVYWVYAGSQERLRESFQSIGRLLRLTDDKESDVNIHQLVQDYLSDQRNREWLLVVDNVDDRDVVDGQFDIPLISHLPQTTGCTILVTTRDDRIALDLVGNWTEPVKVEAMTPSDARLLLAKKLPSARLRTEHQETLLEELGFLPLAITQAASYMSRYRVDTSKYLEYLRQQPAEMLDAKHGTKGFQDPRRDRDQLHAVYASIRLSVERLFRDEPTTAFLLMVVSCFDRNDIPVRLLHVNTPQLRKATGLPAAFANEKEHLESIGSLLSLAILDETADGSAYTMHRLIRLFVRERVQCFEDPRSVVCTAECLLLTAWPNNAAELNVADEWQLATVLFPHAQATLNEQIGPESGTPSSPEQRILKSGLLLQVGMYLSRLGRVAEAITVFDEARVLLLNLQDANLDATSEDALLVDQLSWCR